MYLKETIRPYLKASSITAHAGDKVSVLSIQGEVCMCQTELGAKFSVHQSKLSEIRPHVQNEAPLTNTQAQIVDFLRQNPGSFLRPFKSMSSAKCFRLLDAKINPIMNVAVVDVEYLSASGIINKQPDHTYIL